MQWPLFCGLCSMTGLGVCDFVAGIGGFLLKDAIVPRWMFLMVLVKGMLMLELGL